MQLSGRLPSAGTIRIGRPPEQGRNYPTKISFFEFCLPERNKRGFFSRDEIMHQLFGDEPKTFGPVYFISDKPHEAVSIGLNIWVGAQGKPKKRRCYKIIDPLSGGVVDDGRPASRLKRTKEGDIYEDYQCLSDKCPDFIKGACNKSTRYRFFIPQAPRLGEYGMTVHSYAGISSAIGLMNVLKSILSYDAATGILHGLSKIPIMFRLEQGVTRHKGQDVPIWFPVPYTESQGGAFFMLEKITNDEKALLGSSGEKIRQLQLADAERLLLEEHPEVEVEIEAELNKKDTEANSPEHVEEMEKQEDSVSLTQGQEEASVAEIAEEVVVEKSEEKDAPKGQPNEMSESIIDFDSLYGDDADSTDDDDADTDTDDDADADADKPKENDDVYNDPDDLLSLIPSAIAAVDKSFDKNGILYKRIEKDGIITIETEKITNIPSEYEKCEGPSGETIDGVFSYQVGSRTSEINLILTDKRLIDLFNGSTWTSRPHKVLKMLQVKGVEYTEASLHKNQKA